ncbi:MAG: threonine ammonia-lyase [Bdellovibrionales bacterium]|nr:threonine ammonia-lyase [Bdellovibrionales bacterium]
MKVGLKEIQAAQANLSRILVPTPLLHNPWLSKELGCEIYLKLETAQPIGSFKIRGATHAILSLSDTEKKKGVVAASAGNHAQGVAWGSRQAGVQATIVMPKNAPLMKIQNTRALGAEVVLAGDNYDEAYLEAQAICKKTGSVYIHAFQDANVIAGQGTVGLEIFEQLPSVDVVVASIGGGGLVAGIAVTMKALKPSVKVYGAQAAGAASMQKSFEKKKAVTLDGVSTFADGIAVSKASEELREILQPKVEKVLSTDDENIAAAILMLLEKAKVVTEGAAAVSLAVLDQIRSEIKGKHVVVVLGGGNIDVNVLGRIIDRGLIRAGRRLRINCWVADRPGSLAKLTDTIAKGGANILQAIHDRSEPSTSIDQTEVALTLETKGPDHSAELIRALKGAVIRLEQVD